MKFLKIAYSEGIKQAIITAAKHFDKSHDVEYQLKQRFPLKSLFLDIRDDLKTDKFSGKKIYLCTDQNVDINLLSGAIKLDDIDSLTSDEVANGVFYVYFLCDSEAIKIIRKIIHSGGTLIPHLDYSKTSYRFIDALANTTLRKTYALNERISHFNILNHENLCEALNITKDVEGDYVEIGVYKGGSALTVLNYMDGLAHYYKNNKKAWLFDTFEGFTYSEANSSGDKIWAGTHTLYGRDETIAYLTDTFASIKTAFKLIPTNICRDELPSDIKQISVANIDVDMYEPTRDALRKVSPLVQVGGIIICEDPAATPALYGAYLAMDDFLQSEAGSDFVKFFKGGQYFLFKKSNNYGITHFQS